MKDFKVGDKVKCFFDGQVDRFTIKEILYNRQDWCTPVEKDMQHDEYFLEDLVLDEEVVREFKIGDKVIYEGFHGVVSQVDFGCKGHNYPILVKLNNMDLLSFTKDGKYWENQGVELFHRDEEINTSDIIDKMCSFDKIEISDSLKDSLKESRELEEKKENDTVKQTDNDFEFKVGDRAIYNQVGELSHSFTIKEIFTGQHPYHWCTPVEDTKYKEYSLEDIDKITEEKKENDTVKPTNKDFEFKVGDIVECGGIEGEITSTYNIGKYPLRVNFGIDNVHTTSFTLKGVLDICHKKPLLIFISRPVEDEEFMIKRSELLVALMKVGCNRHDIEMAFDYLGYKKENV